MSIRQSDICAVTIGDSGDSLMGSVYSQLSKSLEADNVTVFATIADALSDEHNQIAKASLVVVVQTWSGQYSSTAVNELIGKTLHTRLICVL